jgi:hypothetical protein
MAIFGVLDVESVVQVDDQTRLSGVKSFLSKDNAAITLVEIEPEAGSGFITVTGTSSKDWFLDWSYSGVSRTVVASLRITAGSTLTFTKSISVVTAADDKLFSADVDLIELEPDLLNYVPRGRSSYLNVHRAAQKKIMDWLNESGVVDVSGNKLTKADVVDLDEVRAWSRDLTLSLIFKGLQNAVDDVFSDKAKYYESQAANRQNRARLRLDLNNDGSISLADSVNMTSRDLIRE